MSYNCQIDVQRKIKIIENESLEMCKNLHEKCANTVEAAKASLKKKGLELEMLLNIENTFDNLIQDLCLMEDNLNNSDCFSKSLRKCLNPNERDNLIKSEVKLEYSKESNKELEDSLRQEHAEITNVQELCSKNYRFIVLLTNSDVEREMEEHMQSIFKLVKNLNELIQDIFLHNKKIEQKIIDVQLKANHTETLIHTVNQQVIRV